MEFKQDLSREIFERKYCLHGETSVDEVFTGVAKEIASVEKEDKREFWEKVFYEAMKSGIFIPAGRILANARPNSPMKNYNNCFTIDLTDSIKGIFTSLKEDALISQMGGGVGFNASKLRPRFSIISKGGYSTGVMSFAEIFNTSAFSIHTGGGRRSAHIMILDIWHPDVLEFIEYKKGRENNALTQFNISVGITDEFMRAVENDEPWHLVFPLMKHESEDECETIWKKNPFDEEYARSEGYKLDGKGNVLMKIYNTVSAVELYDTMTKQAWWYNEPGALFLDTIQRENNAPHLFTIDRCNPCVAEGTLVNTPFGYRKVEDIKKGDLICTLHKKGYEPVEEIEIHDNMLINEVTFSDGNIQYVTDAHIYHVKKKGNMIERLRFDTLKVGDRIQFQPTEILGDIDCESEDYKKALLAGILLGDGCYTEKTLEAGRRIRIATSIDDVEYNDSVMALIEELGYGVGKLYNNGKSKSATFSIIDGENLLKDLDLEAAYSYEKEIPFSYFNNKNKLAGVVNGLLASDGNISVINDRSPLIRLKTSSKKLYDSYRRVLINLGVNCGMYYGEREKQTNGIIEGREIKRKHHIYEAYTSGRFAIDLIKLLPDNINPKIKEKAEKILYDYIGGGNQYFVEIFEIKRHIGRARVYDLYCKESDSWITEGVVQAGCGEIIMDSYELCCLSSINLSKLVNNPFTDEAEFDFDKFKEIVKVGVRFLDNVLDATDYPIEKIRVNAMNRRRIGLGITGLGDALIKMKIRYGSEESLEFMDMLGRVMANTAYMTSSLLAEEKGSFPVFNDEIGKHGFILKLDEEVKQSIKERGLRNIGIKAVAPTGTVSLTLGNNCSSGIEPIFSLQYDRKVRQDDGTDKTDTIYDDGWLEFLEKFPEYRDGNKELPEYMVVSHQIPIEESINVQSAFQYWVDHSISKTINMPFETTLEEYKDIFMYAWKKGLKGVTSFHEGASMDGILTTKPSEKEELWKTIEVLKNSTKRPEILPCDIYEIQVNKEPVVVLVGRNPEAPYNNAPYEIFYTDNHDGLFNVGKAKTGKIVKIKEGKTKPSRYDLVVEGKRSKIVLEDLAETFNDDYATICRYISLALRHQIPVEFVHDQANKVKKFGTFQKAIARVLKNYIPDGESIQSDKYICPECNTKMVFENGCTVCKNCGYSACG